MASAAAQPVHAVLVGVTGVAADHAQVVVDKFGGILHLDRPGPGAHDAGQAVDLDVAGFEGADAVPVGLLHPAFVAGGILRAFINNRPPARILTSCTFHRFKLPKKYEPGAR